MLSQWELQRLRQIEAHLRAEEPRLTHVLSRGTRWALLTRPAPEVRRGLALVALTMLLGAVLMTVGSVTGNVAAMATGMLVAIVVPLPVWLVATGQSGTRTATGQEA